MLKWRWTGEDGEGEELGCYIRGHGYQVPQGRILYLCMQITATQ